MIYPKATGPCLKVIDYYLQNKKGKIKIGWWICVETKTEVMGKRACSLTFPTWLLASRDNWLLVDPGSRDSWLPMCPMSRDSWLHMGPMSRDSWLHMGPMSRGLYHV